MARINSGITRLHAALVIALVILASCVESLPL